MFFKKKPVVYTKIESGRNFLKNSNWTGFYPRKFPKYAKVNSLPHSNHARERYLS